MVVPCHRLMDIRSADLYIFSAVVFPIINVIVRCPVLSYHLPLQYSSRCAEYELCWTELFFSHTTAPMTTHVEKQVFYIFSLRPIMNNNKMSCNMFIKLLKMLPYTIESINITRNGSLMANNQIKSNDIQRSLSTPFEINLVIEGPSGLLKARPGREKRFLKYPLI